MRQILYNWYKLHCESIRMDTEEALAKREYYRQQMEKWR